MTDHMPKRGREAISAGLRYDILRRCNFACYYCGVPAALGLKALHVDHVVPVVLGGTNDPWNLVASCWDCNLGKAGLPPTNELVRRVRDDYCDYQSPRNARLDQCEHCRLPIEVYEDDDESQNQCSSCNEWGWTANEAGFRLGYDRGYEKAVKLFADYLQTNDGGQP